MNKNADELLTLRENVEKKHMARHKENRLGFTPCAATTNLMLGDALKSVLSFVAKRLGN